MNKENKYFSNIEKLDQICNELKIVKSKFDIVMQGMTIKGLGSKYFSLMSLGKKSFSKEIYENLARNFTKLYSEKNIEKEIRADDLYIDKDKKKENVNLTTVWLEKFDNAGIKLFEVLPKLIFNRARVNTEIADKIEGFILAMKATPNREKKFQDRFYSPEEQLAEIKDEARINSLIDSLKSDGIEIFVGVARFPIISYFAKIKNKEDSSYIIRSIPIENMYSIILFSPIEDHVEYFKFNYTNYYNLETLEKLNQKFPANFDYYNKHLEALDELNSENKPHNEIVNKLGEHFFKLEFNEEFSKIIPDIDHLNFSFNPFHEIIPIKKNKIKLKETTKENEK
jgi:hypothetical protein